jgi:monofunctional biosynthetic peptidoglycan transglycosylase
VRGASTLSQQTAKNLFMWSDRSFLRKGIEAWFTLLMELGWDKSRILEVYLNIVEFGPGIYGAEAAARHYFGKPAARLTRYEASCWPPPCPIPGATGSSPLTLCAAALGLDPPSDGSARAGHPEPGAGTE